MTGAEGVAACFLPGEVVDGKYRVERVLGRGGMGLVLLARNLLLGEPVAIKVLAGRSTPALRGRLLMEARAAARLESDHVVRVFDVGHTSAGDPYLVMEYLAGEPLSEVLERGGPQPVTQSVGWLLEACQGLAVAHCNGIIHRDLKPANLFLCRRRDGSSRLKLLDFGVAKLPAREGLVSTTHPLGSPLYMAPEQLAPDAGVDARLDIWGMGVVLYEALAGKPPFVAHSLLDLAAQLRSEAHVPVRELRPDVPGGLSEAVDRCLAKRREERWQDLVQLARALAPFGPAGAAEALAKIERVLATQEGPGDALTCAGDTVAPDEHESAALSEPAREPELPVPALSLSLGGPGDAPRRGERARRWLLGAGLVGALGYVLGLYLGAPERESRTTPAPAAPTARHALATSLTAAPLPLAGTAPPGAVVSASGSAAVGRTAVRSTPLPSSARPPLPRRATRRDAPRRSLAALKQAQSPAPAGNSQPPPLTAASASSAGPLPLDRQVTW